jgi:hypothetical protein
MYAAQPDASSCSQQQLMQLLLLADRYGVPKVLTALSAALASIPTADLQWETGHAAYALPPGCVKQDVCRCLFASTGEKLQQQLGDLELVWADRSCSKVQLLKSLPLGVLLQLLGDHRTRVASENTVFYTMSAWWDEQEKQGRRDSWQEARRASEAKHLLQQLRIQVRAEAA